MKIANNQSGAGLQAATWASPRALGVLAVMLAGLPSGCAWPGEARAPKAAAAAPADAAGPGALAAAASAGVIQAVPAPPVRSYPSPPEQIQSWIDRLDAPRIRAHAWDVWASITSPSPYPGVPVWETWYSGHELFELGPAARTTRRHLRDFESARQVSRTAAMPSSPAERPTAFNRYSASVAHYVWDQGLNNSNVLNRINDEFNRNRTPVAQRQLQTSAGLVDAASVVLKPVFQFVSGNAATAIPVWTGISPAATTNLDNPSAETWRRCVVLDPTREHPPGATMVMACNAEPPRALPLVSLRDFYAIRLTAAEAAAFSEFAAVSGDDIGKDNKTDRDSVLAMVKAGNLALLTAMHVTTKEINNWTWQTFWWALDPNDPVSGRDRPAFMPRPWSRYNMGTAYYMVSPPTRAEGDPLISFNPYLETNLVGTVPGPKVPIKWTGVHSNCMSCHRMAAWQPAAKPVPGQYGDSPAYRPDGLIDPADPTLFDGYTKLDFLWSLTRAQPPLPQASGPRR